MHFLYGLLPLLGCAVGMAACFLIMRGMMRGPVKGSETESQVDRNEVANLRREVGHLRRQVADPNAGSSEWRRSP